MTNTIQSTGGVNRRREKAIVRLQSQLAKGTKVSSYKDADGKHKADVPLEKADRDRIGKEIETIKRKIS